MLLRLVYIDFEGDAYLVKAKAEARPVEYRGVECSDECALCEAARAWEAEYGRKAA